MVRGPQSRRSRADRRDVLITDLPIPIPGSLVALLRRLRIGVDAYTVLARTESTTSSCFIDRPTARVANRIQSHLRKHVTDPPATCSLIPHTRRRGNDETVIAVPDSDPIDDFLSSASENVQPAREMVWGVTINAYQQHPPLAPPAPLTTQRHNDPPLLSLTIHGHPEDDTPPRGRPWQQRTIPSNPTTHQGCPYIRRITTVEWPNLGIHHDQKNKVDSTLTYLEWPTEILCPPTYQARCQDLFEQVLSLAQQYISGTFPFYSPSSQDRNSKFYFTGEHARWVNDHSVTIMGANRDLSALQSVADNFSSAFGIQRMHAVTFLDRIRFDPARTGRNHNPVLVGTRNTVFEEAAYTLVRLCDAGRHRPPLTHPDMDWSLKSLRFLEWLHLLNIAVSHSTRQAVTTPLLQRSILPLARSILTTERSTTIFDRWAKRRMSGPYSLQRAAGGARWIGSALPIDRTVHDALPRPLVPDHVETYPHRSDEWTLLDVHTPVFDPTPDVKPDLDADSPAPTSTLNLIYQHADYDVPDTSLVIRGSPRDPEHVPTDVMQEIIALMTPPNLPTYPYPILQHVQPYRCRFRRDGDNNFWYDFGFVSSEHLLIALHRSHRWVPLLRLTNPVAVPNSNSYGEFHPMSTMHVTAEFLGQNPVTVLAMCGHQQLPHVPESALFTKRTADSWHIRLRYRSPTEALRMIDQRFIMAARSANPYTAAQYSDRVTPHLSAGTPPYCRRCGALGHDRFSCSLDGRPPIADDHCATCWLAGTPQTHSASVACTHAVGMRLNTQHIFRHLRSDRDNLSVFARRHHDWFETFFAECGPPASPPPTAQPTPFART